MGTEGQENKFFKAGYFAGLKLIPGEIPCTFLFGNYCRELAWSRG
jgi:hypothetical protein